MNSFLAGAAWAAVGPSSFSPRHPHNHQPTEAPHESQQTTAFVFGFNFSFFIFNFALLRAMRSERLRSESTGEPRASATGDFRMATHQRPRSNRPLSQWRSDRRLA